MVFVTPFLTGCVADANQCASYGLEPGQDGGCSESDYFFSRHTYPEQTDELISQPWQNKRTGAVLDWRTQVESGVVTLVIIDADAQPVFNQTFEKDGEPANFELPKGTTGKWRLNLTLEDFKGTVDFTLRSKGLPSFS